MKHSPIRPPQHVPLMDATMEREIFCTGVSGCAMFGGTVVVTLESARCDHNHTPPTLERMVVGRLALTPHAAQALVAGLNQFLEQQGLSPTAAMVGGATRQ